MTILLSNATINNDAPAQTIIGTLSAQDQSGNVIPCNFSLTKGSIGYFAVSGNQLMTAWSSPAAPGFYSVRVHAIGSTMRFSGRATFTIAVAAASSPPPPPPPSSHAVVIGLAEDAYQGDAQYSLAVDGSVLIPGGTVTVLNSSGNSQDVPISVSDGSHTIVVTFLNDAYGGSPELDRNLYVNYVKYDGVVVPGAQATLLRTGDNFSVTVGSGAAPPPTPALPQPVITVTPSTPQVPDTTPLGAVVATYVVSMSDGTPFSGTVQFGAPNFDGGGVFALSGNNIIVNPNGPGVGPNMTTITDHITLQATA